MHMRYAIQIRKINRKPAGSISENGRIYSYRQFKSDVIKQRKNKLKYSHNFHRG